MFELAFHTCTRLQEAEIKGMQDDWLERFRHVALCNTQRQCFNQRGFTDAWFTDQDRVVLSSDSCGRLRTERG
ncbi:Protein of uncharacterised function (DUF3170) [Klebsiella pneumoniae]|nr:hypothetical protein AM422_002909 [Klebsiella pneumoniae]SBZ41867.1 Protein of uncharacterised function (DUF3170) [Klebsiella pneumoniae]SSH28727.1 Protein of uncharacterised function (DUF3170) [Klebsiella pneumoniae]SWR99598.1 Protein of uncharacterised function (DUF3170) [Klebsiella pneumoniae]VAO25460.1 Protein of uncharacterised function (DUF3170) [Klebsiella pneumoniae]